MLPLKSIGNKFAPVNKILLITIICGMLLKQAKRQNSSNCMFICLNRARNGPLVKMATWQNKTQRHGQTENVEIKQHYSTTEVYVAVLIVLIEGNLRK